MINNEKNIDEKKKCLIELDQIVHNCDKLVQLKCGVVKLTVAPQERIPIWC